MNGETTMKERLHRLYGMTAAVFLCGYLVTVLGEVMKLEWMLMAGAFTTLGSVLLGIYTWRERSMFVDEERRERIRLETRARYAAELRKQRRPA